MADRFPAALADLMRRRKLSGPKLAGRIRTGHTTVYEWLAGNNRPNWLTAVGLSKVLRWPEVVPIVERDIDERKQARAAVPA